MVTELVSSKVFLLGSQMAVCKFLLHSLRPGCVCVLRASICKDTGHMGVEPIPMTSFYLK